MVLSNKKLKKKLRADLSESLAESEAKKIPQNKDSTETHRENSEAHHSLKSLLDSAVQKPRLSKREKRREKTVSSQEGASVANINGGSEGVEEQKRQRKKRKRDGDGGEGSENGASESVEPENAKKSKKKSKKKKKKNKKKKAADNVEVKKVVESEVVATGEQCVAETTKTSDSQEKVDASPKVYVGGIPYYSTEDDIQSFFEGCGSITEIDCMKFPDSGKFRGIAIISFKTEAAAKRALELDGADMGGLFLKIQLYKATRDAKATSDFSPAIVEGYNRIYIGNLSWDITEDELRKLFSDCNISSIRFGEDKETGQFRGYAHVDFADSLSVTMALKLDQTSVCGRPVRIRCAVPKKVTKIDSKSVSTSEKADNGGVSSNSKPMPTNEEPTASISVPTSAEVDNGGASSVSGKIRRRTCYECGERGHLSSSCPKKQAADPINSRAS